MHSPGHTLGISSHDDADDRFLSVLSQPSSVPPHTKNTTRIPTIPSATAHNPRDHSCPGVFALLQPGAHAVGRSYPHSVCPATLSRALWRVFPCHFTGEHGIGGAYKLGLPALRLSLNGVLAVRGFPFLSSPPDAWCRFLVVQEGLSTVSGNPAGGRKSK